MTLPRRRRRATALHPLSAAIVCALLVFLALNNFIGSTPTLASLTPKSKLVSIAANRRGLLIGGLSTFVASAQTLLSKADEGATLQFESMEALKGKDYGKSRMKFSDFVQSPTGLQYKDMRMGSGKSPSKGDECIIDWSGYTIGYYGRPFEARDKAKGGDFTGNEKELFRFQLGENTNARYQASSKEYEKIQGRLISVILVIPAFEEALQGMKEGGIRRIIVPVELGYPDNDMKKKGPRPTTFSGKRALGFVLENQGMIDKTLLFDIELIKVKNPK